MSFKLHLVNLLVRRIDPRNNRQLKFHACYSLSVWTKQFLGFKKQRNTNVLLILMKELNHFCTKKKKIAMYIHLFFRLANKLYFYFSRNLFIILIFIEKLMNAWGLFMYFFNEHLDHYCIFWTLFFCLLVGVWTNWPGEITILFQFRLIHFKYKSNPGYKKGKLIKWYHWRKCNLILHKFLSMQLWISTKNSQPALLVF